jgi:hypothetical protein
VHRHFDENDFYKFHGTLCVLKFKLPKVFLLNALIAEEISFIIVVGGGSKNSLRNFFKSILDFIATLFCVRAMKSAFVIPPDRHICFLCLKNSQNYFFLGNFFTILF